MSIGVAVIDADHKRLVELINAFFNGVSAGRGREAEEEALDALVAYMNEHFEREEALFTEAGYEGAEAHREEHDTLRCLVLDARAKFQSQEETYLSIDVADLLKIWWTEHIQGNDMAFAPLLIAKGIGVDPAEGVR